MEPRWKKKKKTGEINFSNISYFIQYIRNIIISTYTQYLEIINEIFSIPFFGTKSLNTEYFTLGHLSLRTSHVSSSC